MSVRARNRGGKICIRLRDERVAQGLTQKKVGAAARVRPNYLSEIEGGAVPSDVVIDALARVLDLSFDWVVSGRGRKKRENDYQPLPKDEDALLEDYRGVSDVKRYLARESMEALRRAYPRDADDQAS